MAVKSELEGLISNHNQLISRGSVRDAAKVKELIGGYLSGKDMMPRIYKAVRGMFEEFLYCAETNFNRFREIINYRHLTELEFFYPEFFRDFSDDLHKSCKKMEETGSPLYSGLLVASSIHASRDVLVRVIGGFLENKQYDELERVFERLDETRQLKMSLSPQEGIIKDVPLISDQEKRQKIVERISDAYRKEVEVDERGQPGSTAALRNAYKLASILSTYFPEQGVVSEESMVSVAVDYFKQMVRQVDEEDIGELVSFMERFRRNPVIRRFSQENPERFSNSMSAAETRNILDDLVRKLLGKTRFEDVNLLAKHFDGIMSFQPIFKERLGTLKQSGFYVQAIEMAEKLQMKEELTDDLKLEAFRKLLDELRKNPTRGGLLRLKKFSSRQGIHTENFPHIRDFVPGRLDELERFNPELAHDMDRIYSVLRLERKQQSQGIAFSRMFEPIIWFFTAIFKLFLKIVISPVQEKASKGSGQKTAG